MTTVKMLIGRIGEIYETRKDIPVFFIYAASAIVCIRGYVYEKSVLENLLGPRGPLRLWGVYLLLVGTAFMLYKISSLLFDNKISIMSGMLYIFVGSVIRPSALMSYNAIFTALSCVALFCYLRNGRRIPPPVAYLSILTALSFWSRPFTLNLGRFLLYSRYSLNFFALEQPFYIGVFLTLSFLFVYDKIVYLKQSRNIFPMVGYSIVLFLAIIARSSSTGHSGKLSLDLQPLVPFCVLFSTAALDNISRAFIRKNLLFYAFTGIVVISVLSAVHRITPESVQLSSSRLPGFTAAEKIGKDYVFREHLNEADVRLECPTKIIYYNVWKNNPMRIKGGHGERGPAKEGVHEGRWDSMAEEWQIVSMATMRCGGILKECIWAHPGRNGRLFIVFPNVLIGKHLDGSTGMTDLVVSKRKHNVLFSIYIGKEPAYRQIYTKNESGWKNFDIDTAKWRNKRRNVTFVIAADTPGKPAWLHFCFDVAMSK